MNYWGIFCFLCVCKCEIETNINSKKLSTRSIDLEVSSAPFGWLLSLNSYTPYASQKSGVSVHCFKTRNASYDRSCGPDENELTDDNEGLSLTVLNQRTGTITLQKNYPLFEFWIHWADLLWNIENISPGRILIFSFSGKGSDGLRDARTFLSKLGSVLVKHLSKNTNWIWIYIKHGQTLLEASSINGYPVMQAHMNFSLLHIKTPVETSAFDKYKWEVCQTNEMLGDFCSENNPLILCPKVNVSMENLENVPLIITGGSRFHYFYSTLSHVLRTPGVVQKNIFVILGTEDKLYTDFLTQLDIRFTSMKLTGKSNSHLFQYYRRVYQFVADNYDSSPAVIFLDEDVEVSPDFFFYMNQTIPLLKQDETLACVNSFSTIRSDRLFYDPHIVLRSLAQVSWGYSVSLKFVNEALGMWSNDSSIEALFDTWLMLGVMNGRECIYPEQTRSKHIGIVGVNTHPSYEMESYNLLLPMTDTYGIKLKNLNKIIYPNWKLDLISEIKSAQLTKSNPCSESFFKEVDSGTYVFYFKLKGLSPEYTSTFYYVGTCLGIWSQSFQGLHDGTFTVRLKRNAIVHAIGVPLSSLSHLMPKDIKPLDMLALEGNVQQEMIRFASHFFMEKRYKIASANDDGRKEETIQELFDSNILLTRGYISKYNAGYNAR